MTIWDFEKKNKKKQPSLIIVAIIILINLNDVCRLKKIKD